MQGTRGDLPSVCTFISSWISHAAEEVRPERQPESTPSGWSCQGSVTTAWPQIRPGRRAPARQPAGLAMTAPHPGSVPAAESQVVELAACPAGPNTVGVPGALPEPPRTSGQGGGEDTVRAPGGSAFSQGWLSLPTDSLADMVVASSPPHTHPTGSQSPQRLTRCWPPQQKHEPVVGSQPGGTCGLSQPNPYFTAEPGRRPLLSRIVSSLQVPRHAGRVL